MERRINLTHLILAVIVASILILLMIAVDAQAQIAFVSGRSGNAEIYVMDADGGNQLNLTNHPEDDIAPAWFGSPFSVAPAGKKLTIWGQVKQADR